MILIMFMFFLLLVLPMHLPVKNFSPPVEKIEIVSDYIVKLILKEPYVPLMLALGNAENQGQ